MGGHSQQINTIEDWKEQRMGIHVIHVIETIPSNHLRIAQNTVVPYRWEQSRPSENRMSKIVSIEWINANAHPLLEFTGAKQHMEIRWNRITIELYHEFAHLSL